LFAEPHLYRRFGAVFVRFAYEQNTQMGVPTARSFRRVEKMIRFSIVAPLSIVFVLLAVSIAANGFHQ